jgi:chitinase
VNNQNATTGRVVVQQAFQNLPKAPLLPFVDIARIFLRQQAKMPVLPYFEQVAGFVNRTRDALSGVFGPHPRPSKRQSTTNEGQCSPSSPRPDGSCCNINGGCGYGPANCGAGNCTSNCMCPPPHPIAVSKETDQICIGNATALCGRDSLNGNVSCPLNVCCSYYGYCGVCVNPNGQNYY